MKPHATARQKADSRSTTAPLAWRRGDDARIAESASQATGSRTHSHCDQLIDVRPDLAIGPDRLAKEIDQIISIGGIGGTSDSLYHNLPVPRRPIAGKRSR